VKPTVTRRMETEKPKSKRSAKAAQSAQTELTAPAPPAVANESTAAANATGQLRENPRINEKIDEWIKRNPDQFKFFNEMPHDRAVRKLILNEIDKYERREKAKSYRQQEQQNGEQAPRHDNRQSQGNGMRR